MTCKNKQ